MHTSDPRPLLPTQLLLDYSDLLVDGEGDGVTDGTPAHFIIASGSTQLVHFPFHRGLQKKIIV